MDKHCLLTFDVEEWFQVENLRAVFPSQTWKNQTSTVLKNTIRILHILDKYQIKATFFVLGWVANNTPQVAEQIKLKGHEIASHGSGHDLTYNLDEDELYADVKNSKEKLKQITGNKILGYRAPNFSVNEKLIKILKDLNFQYDSSYNPFQLNSRYGKLEVDSYEENKSFYRLEENFYEVPMSTLKLFGKHFPMAGGAFFRIFPFPIFKKLVKEKMKKDGLYHFYLHPWEFEPEQPRIKNIKLNYRLRHYTGLKNTATKFEKLIHFLNKMDCQFMTISEYIRTFSS